jgi:GTP-dependent phosphoenolpyruvate carboxykinase
VYLHRTINRLSKFSYFMRNKVIVIYTISGIKAILQDSSVKIADDEGVSPSSSVITRVSCNML